MDFTEFKEDEYPLLINWIPDAEFNLLWGGPAYTFPLTVEQIKKHNSDPQVHSFALRDEGRILGLIEVFQVSDTECRLCRVLVVDKDSRGKGYGKLLVKNGVEYAKKTFGASLISLGVFEKNEPAIKCYKAMGFSVYERSQSSRSFNGEFWPLLRMRKTV